MKSHFRLFFVLLSVFLLAILCVAQAEDTSVSVPQIATLPDWLSRNWTIVALGISEAMAFLPAKFAGIAKAAWSIIAAVFGKKS
jgi:hypothetical protein